jgi:hypothetical protein
LTIIVVLVAYDEVVSTVVDVRVDDEDDTAVVIVEDASEASGDSSAVEQPNTPRDISPTSPRDRILPTTAS